MNQKKLYVLVRKDLPQSYRAVQAGHAVAEYLLRGPDTSWSNGTLIYLGVKGLFQLEKWVYRLEAAKVSFVTFREPDIGDELTALATEYGDAFKNLQTL